MAKIITLDMSDLGEVEANFTLLTAAVSLANGDWALVGESEEEEEEMGNEDLDFEEEDFFFLRDFFSELVSRSKYSSSSSLSDMLITTACFLRFSVKDSDNLIGERVACCFLKSWWCVHPKSCGRGSKPHKQRLDDPMNSSELFEVVYDGLVTCYVRPTHPVHVVITSCTFLTIMLTICYLVERTNPDRDVEVRKAQIKQEVYDAIPAVFASTFTSVFVLNYIYPVRWGFEAPVFPNSLSRFAVEFLYWMVCFEVNSYYLHRTLHMRKPIDLYRLVHRSHHLFFFPTAFASQSISIVESVLFALCAFGAALFVMPISVCTQYVCGLLLLTWSIFAHDSRFILDGGAHFEHHSHPNTNLGFTGLMDILHHTVWWGASYDDPSTPPAYVGKWKRVHEFVFRSTPISAGDEGLKDMVKDFPESTKHELKERRHRIMQDRQLAREGKKN